MITIFAYILEKYRNLCARLHLQFRPWDDGDAFTQVEEGKDTRYTVPGVLYVTSANNPLDISAIPMDNNKICVIAQWQDHSSVENPDQSPPKGQWKAQGFVQEDNQWKDMPVQIMPIREDLFSRAVGLIDSSVISEAHVLIVGLGSVGSLIAVELAKAGIMHMILMDHDRFTVANVARSTARIEDVGRRKTKVVEERIHQKNCYARTETHDIELIWREQEIELARQLVQRSDIVIGSVDNREPRVILNRLCVQEDTPLILMGAGHRASHGQVLFVKKPGPCYQCFLMALPPNSDRGTSSLGQGTRTAYADHPVQDFEPGLSIDIAPISIMCLKLCITELLKDKPTTMRSLDEDLIAPWYIYINRREGPYEKLQPLAFNVGDGMHILSWYGIDLKANPACPVCGDNHINERSKIYGL